MLWMVREWPLFRWLSSCLFWAAKPRLFWLRVQDAAALWRSRQELAALDERLCDDIGVTLYQAEREANRPVRDELSPWAPPELRQAAAAARHYGRGPQDGYRSFYRSRGRGDLPGSLR